MAYDEALAARIRHLVQDEDGISEKKMFGGLGFLVHGNMAVGATSSGGLMLRSDPAVESDLIGEHVRPHEMGGRTMRGWLFVEPPAMETDEQLADIVERGVGYARTLPPK